MTFKLLPKAPSLSLQRWFWFLLTLNVLFIIGSVIYLHPLSFGDMMQLEVAKKTPVAERLLQEWYAAGKMEKAVESIYVDFLFIILYTTGLGAACLYLSRLTAHEVLIRAGKAISWLLVAAGICDVIENFTIMKILGGAVTSFNVMLTYDMAAAKFSVIILSLLFLLVCLIFWLINKLVR